jgi:hypothetical protein
MDMTEPKTAEDPTTLLFDATSVFALLRHTEKCRRRRASFVQRWDPRYRHDNEPFSYEEEGRDPLPQEVDNTCIPPGLHLASRGRLVYLVSNGIPIQRDRSEGLRMRAAYADGYGPTDSPNRLPPALKEQEHARFVPAGLFWTRVVGLAGGGVVALKVDPAGTCSVYSLHQN